MTELLCLILGGGLLIVFLIGMIWELAESNKVSFGWWLVLIVSGGLLYFGRVPVTNMIAAVGMFFFGIWRFIVAHPWQIAFWTSGYLLTGAIWSVVKWWSMETNRVRKARSEYKYYVTHLVKPGSTAKSFEDWSSSLRSDPSMHTSEIVTWIALWPASILYTAFADYITRICRRIATELRAVYQRISDYVWARAAREFAK